ncbi:hypothetical protein [Streptomyces sp. NPDC052015]|uniref:hypothetical protein n=1 Tax=Streptomyces sp. NPDC052015 TaxID=3154755 RepID=UPI0034231F1B
MSTLENELPIAAKDRDLVRSSAMSAIHMAATLVRPQARTAAASPAVLQPT